MGFWYRYLEVDFKIKILIARVGKTEGTGSLYW